MTSPVPEIRLKQIASDACASALEKAERYEHSRMEEWNGQIINQILQSLISESKGDKPDASCPFKFAINSTIIQHLEDPAPKGTDENAGSQRKVGRRGMHSAAGAYWNNEKDGMWSFKWEGGEAKGMDVVVSVIWIAV
ncbi:hypothetical protein C1H76_9398 [Elsinoe australis]|uniref:Dynein light chain n=1 Tax=Elsinoe australis TaxID=40998 RepID=A0A2P7YEP4_9PEZI|nr:hypothetical protein B9Z65_8755 [Elsinoe australis]TKX18608.1 hypothetical protein C1H76_9398 [Elsinoe australis]